MARLIAAAVATLSALVAAQQVGTLQAENHPAFTTYDCDASGNCNPDSSTSIVLDANWRWTHQVGSSTNCYTGDEWDASLCPDPTTCATNCALDGADYAGVYGIQTSGDQMSITLVTKGQYDTNIGARTYVMADESHYKMWMLKNREFAFTTDLSSAPCGVNGALYFVDMDADGGLSKYPTNKAGAAYGTGYCDAQCPQDIKFINGQANIMDWIPDPNGDPDSGFGEYGSCCTELDIMESNSISMALTPHMCTVDGQYRCNGTECGDSAGTRFLGICDKNGCDINPYRGGVTNFYGPGGAPAGACNLQPNTNNMGTIMGTPSVQTDPTACCALCNSTAGCVGFTYIESTYTCFLKSALGTPIADSGATSGSISTGPTGPSIDTTQPFTVVTQFITSDGTDSGDLVEIRRFFVQNGVKIAHPNATNINATGVATDRISDAFCKAKAAAYGDNDNFEAFGGLQRMGEVMDGGMVLVLSQWVDYEAHMLWLDSTYPTNATGQPGAARGSCSITSGNPPDVISNNPGSTVSFSKVSLGPIGFTEAALAKGHF